MWALHTVQHVWETTQESSSGRESDKTRSRHRKLEQLNGVMCKSETSRRSTLQRGHKTGDGGKFGAGWNMEIPCPCFGAKWEVHDPGAKYHSGRRENNSILGPNLRHEGHGGGACATNRVLAWARNCWNPTDEGMKTGWEVHEG